MKILILGVSGMLGNAMFRIMAERQDLDVYGTARSDSIRSYFSSELARKIMTGIDVQHQDSLALVFTRVKPHVVVNCVGLVKQLENANDPLLALPINALLPHKLARLCELAGARMIHISTDCVFSGKKGNYKESDASDAYDLYGRTKCLGEVDYAHTLTLRTSIIGHELFSTHGLINWFLSQSNQVKGYTQAIFSGLPTVELSLIVRDVLLQRPDLFGLYHVASESIDKYSLLKLVSEIYEKSIEIVPDQTIKINRSLDAKRFFSATGYQAPSWPILVKKMYEFK